MIIISVPIAGCFFCILPLDMLVVIEHALDYKNGRFLLGKSKPIYRKDNNFYIAINIYINIYLYQQTRFLSWQSACG